MHDAGCGRLSMACRHPETRATAGPLPYRASATNRERRRVPFDLPGHPKKAQSRKPPSRRGQLSLRTRLEHLQLVRSVTRPSERARR